MSAVESTEAYWMRRALAADETIVKLEHRLEVEHDRAEDLLKDFNYATKMRDKAEWQLDRVITMLKDHPAAIRKHLDRLWEEHNEGGHDG